MPTFAITRTAHIDAAPERVHALIDSLASWEGWSPWQDLDPVMQQTYTGPDTGVGSAMTWKGNKRAGEGSMEVISSTPAEIQVRVAFIKPFKDTNLSTFALAGSDGGTDVAWTMSGKQNAFGKLFFTLFKMEDKLGADFTKGLGRLKALAEGA